MANDNNARRELYDALASRKLYTKGYDDFCTQFSDEKARGELYDALASRKLYTKSAEEFDAQFFGDLGAVQEETKVEGLRTKVEGQRTREGVVGGGTTLPDNIGVTFEKKGDVGAMGVPGVQFSKPKEEWKGVTGDNDLKVDLSAGAERRRKYEPFIIGTASQEALEGMSDAELMELQKEVARRRESAYKEKVEKMTPEEQAILKMNITSKPGTNANLAEYNIEPGESGFEKKYEYQTQSGSRVPEKVAVFVSPDGKKYTEKEILDTRKRIGMTNGVVDALTEPGDPLFQAENRVGGEIDRRVRKDVTNTADKIDRERAALKEREGNNIDLRFANQYLTDTQDILKGESKYAAADDGILKAIGKHFEGVGRGIWDIDNIPIAGGVIEVSRNTEVALVALKKNRGDKLTKSEEVLLDSYFNYLYAENIASNFGTAYGTGVQGGQSLAFMAEMLVFEGLAKMGGKLAVKAGAKTLPKIIASMYGEFVAKKGGEKLAIKGFENAWAQAGMKLAGTVAQTALMPETYAAISDKRARKIAATGKDMTTKEVLIAGVDQWIEVASERIADKFNEFVTGKVYKALDGMGFSLFGKLDELNGFARRTMQSVKSQPIEMMEEGEAALARIGLGMLIGDEQMVEDNKKLFTSEGQRDLFLSFIVPGIVGGGMHRAQSIAINHRFNKRRLALANSLTGGDLSYGDALDVINVAEHSKDAKEFKSRAQAMYMQVMQNEIANGKSSEDAAKSADKVVGEYMDTLGEFADNALYTLDEWNKMSKGEKDAAWVNINGVVERIRRNGIDSGIAMEVGERYGVGDMHQVLASINDGSSKLEELDSNEQQAFAAYAQKSIENNIIEEKIAKEAAVIDEKTDKDGNIRVVSVDGKEHTVVSDDGQTMVVRDENGEKRQVASDSVTEVSVKSAEDAKQEMAAEMRDKVGKMAEFKPGMAMTMEDGRAGVIVDQRDEGVVVRRPRTKKEGRKGEDGSTYVEEIVPWSELGSNRQLLEILPGQIIGGMEVRNVRYGVDGARIWFEGLNAPMTLPNLEEFLEKQGLSLGGELKANAEGTAVKKSDVELAKQRVELEKEIKDEVKELEKRFGVEIVVAEDMDEVDDTDVQNALSKDGTIVKGWYNKKGKTVGIYLPMINSVSEVKSVVFHEVVGHKGLRQLVGESKFAEICKRVYDEVMNEDERRHYERMATLGGAKGKEKVMLAAADEFMADMAGEVANTEQGEAVGKIEKIWKIVQDYLNILFKGKAPLTRDEVVKMIVLSERLLENRKEFERDRDNEKKRNRRAEERAEAKRVAAERKKKNDKLIREKSKGKSKEWKEVFRAAVEAGCQEAMDLLTSTDFASALDGWELASGVIAGCALPDSTGKRRGINLDSAKKATGGKSVKDYKGGSLVFKNTPEAEYVGNLGDKVEEAAADETVGVELGKPGIEYVIDLIRDSGSLYDMTHVLENNRIDAAWDLINQQKGLDEQSRIAEREARRAKRSKEHAAEEAKMEEAAAEVVRESGEMSEEERLLRDAIEGASDNEREVAFKMEEVPTKQEVESEVAEFLAPDRRSLPERGLRNKHNEIKDAIGSLSIANMDDIERSMAAIEKGLSGQIVTYYNGYNLGNHPAVPELVHEAFNDVEYMHEEIPGNLKYLIEEAKIDYKDWQDALNEGDLEMAEREVEAAKQRIEELEKALAWYNEHKDEFAFAPAEFFDVDGRYVGASNVGNVAFKMEVSPEMDAEYLEAVEKGDMEKAQGMVRKAAKKAGYTIKGYHGSKGSGFNTFDMESGHVWVSSDKKHSMSYARGKEERLYSLFAKLNNPIKVGNVDTTLLESEDYYNTCEKLGVDPVELARECLPEEWQMRIDDLVEEDMTEQEKIDNAMLGISYFMVTNSKRFAEIAKEKGYDGIAATEELSDGTRIDTYAVFDASQVKSADAVTYDDEGKVVPLSERFDEGEDDIRFKMEVMMADPFMSNAAVAVEGIKQEKASGEQWINMLKNNGGLKAEEDKWIGLSDWLKGKKSVTKDEVKAYIAENAVKVEDVEYGENTTFEWNNTSYDELKLLSDIEHEFDNLKIEYGAEESFKKMCERHPGLEEYAKITGSIFEWLVEYDEIAFEEWGKKEWEKKDKTKKIHSVRLEYTTSGLENKKEIALVVPTVESYNKNDEIHFGDAGEGRAVAWVRFGDAKNTDGKRVLVIDEIQSKRHQDGREKGYKLTEEEKDLLFNNYKKAERKYMDTQNELMDKGIDALLIAYYDLDMISFEELSNEIGEEDAIKLKEVKDECIDALNKKVTAIDSLYFERMVPDAPFQKNWQELAMKRMLRYAAENGYDMVAWTTGAQQAERYQIGRQIRSIKRGGESMFGDKEIILDNYGRSLTILIDEGGIVVGGDFDNAIGNPLSAVIGKELAEKVMNLKEGEKIESEGLNVGGDGMKGFYDQMLPRFMNKYGKKWGVNTEDIELDLPREADRVMHGVEVNEAMKESVMGGQVMFKMEETEWDKMDDRQREIVVKAAEINRRRPQFRVGRGNRTESVVEFFERHKRWREEVGDEYKALTGDELPEVPRYVRGAMTLTEYFNAYAKYEYEYDNAETAAEWNKMMGKANSNASWFVRVMFDRMHRLEMFYNSAKKAGLNVNTNNDAYSDVFRRQKRAQRAIEIFTKDYLLPMKKRNAYIVKLLKDKGDWDFTWKLINDKDVKKYKHRREGKKVKAAELAYLYLQAKDIIEVEQIHHEVLQQIAEAEERRKEAAKAGNMEEVQRIANEITALQKKGEGYADRGRKGFEVQLGAKPEDVVSYVEKVVGKDKGLDELWKSIREVCGAAFDYMIDGGYASEEQKAAIIGGRQFYVPERGFAYNEHLDDTAMASPFEKAEGRVSLAANPYIYLTEIAESAIQLTERNRTKQHMWNFLSDNRNWAYMQASGAVKMARVWTIRKFDEKGNFVGEELRFTGPTAEEQAHDTAISQRMKEIQAEVDALRLEKEGKSDEEIEGINKRISVKLGDMYRLNQQKIVVGMVKNELLKGQETLDKIRLGLFSDLTEEEWRELASGAIARANDEKSKDDVLKNIVKVNVNGESYLMWFNDENLATVLNGAKEWEWVQGKDRERGEREAKSRRRILDRKKMTPGDLLIEAGLIPAKITRKLSAFKTQYNWDFSWRNGGRDLQFAFIVNTVEHNPVFAAKVTKNSIAMMPMIFRYLVEEELFDSKNFKDAGQRRRARWIEEFMANGGETGYSFMQPANERQMKYKEEMKKMVKQLDKCKSAKDVAKWMDEMQKNRTIRQNIEHFAEFTSQWSELSTRMGQYVTERTDGKKTAKEAALSAKEITTNFNRQGELASLMGPFYMFYNATLQGTYRVYRSVYKDGELQKKNLAKLLAIKTGYVLFGLFQKLANPDDPDEETFVPDYMWKTYMKVGDIYLPTPHYFRSDYYLGACIASCIMGEKSIGGAIFDAMTYHLEELVPGNFALTSALKWDEKKKSTGNARLDFDWRMAIRNLMPLANYSFMQPVTDVILNRNYLGAPIYKVPYINDGSPLNEVHMGFSSTPDYVTKLCGAIQDATGKLQESITGVPYSGWQDKYETKGIDINPSIPYYLIKQYGGGVFDLAFKIVSMPFMFTSDGMEARNIPFVGSIYKPYERDRMTTQYFWDIENVNTGWVKEFDSANKTRKKGGDAKKYEYMKESKYNELHKRWNSKEFRKIKSKVEENVTLEDEELEKLIEFRGEWYD